MKNWCAYIQVNGEDVSIFKKITFAVPEKLFQKIQTAVRKEIPLCTCKFYPELLNRAENAFDLAAYVGLGEEKPLREDYDDKEEYLEALDEYNELVENIWDDYCMESLDIYDPSDEIQLKKKFIGKVYPDFAGVGSSNFEAEEDYPACIRFSLTVIFDERGMVKDIINIRAEGLESENVRSSSYGDAYPNCEFLAEILEEQLGDEEILLTK